MHGFLRREEKLSYNYPMFEFQMTEIMMAIKKGNTNALSNTFKKLVLCCSVMNCIKPETMSAEGGYSY